MSKLSKRSINFIIFVFITFLLGFAFYIQAYDKILPCPLCVLQRIVLALIGFIFLLGSIISFKKIGNRLLQSLAFIFSCLGVVLAGRQVWLQHMPTSQGDCGASLEYMLQVFPWHEVAKKIFIGGSECAQVEWKLLHLSMAEWSLLWFAMLAVVSLWQLWRK